MRSQVRGYWREARLSRGAALMKMQIAATPGWQGQSQTGLREDADPLRSTTEGA